MVHRVNLAVCLSVYIGICLFLIPVGTDDIRMLDVFSLDEAKAVAVVAYLFRTGWELDTFSYGGLFYYIPLVVVKCLAWVGFEISHQLIVQIMRGICLGFGVGCVLLVYQMGVLVRGAFVGGGAAWLMVMNPIFLRWSVETHPDLPQLFWVTCSLWVCIRAVATRSVERFWLAGLFAGLAFATKYVGVFLFPVLGVAIFWLYHAKGDGWIWPPKHWRQMAWVLSATVLAFVLAFLITNPFVMVNFEQFWRDVSFERTHLSIGHVFRSVEASSVWVFDFGRLVGVGHSVMFLGALVGMIYWRRFERAQTLLLFWIALLLVYLMAFVNLRGGRYLLPILPSAVLVVALGYHMLFEFLQKRWSGALGGALVVLVFFTIPQIRSNWSFVLQRLERVTQQPEIVAGKWLGENFDPSTSVLYHSYGYVPSKFETVFRTVHMDYLLVNHLQPDLLVVRDASTHEYEDIQNAPRAVGGEQAFWARHYFYHYLKQGILEDYRQTKRFNGVGIYQRIEKKDVARENLSWTQRIVMLSQNQYTGASVAMARLGIVQVLQGKRDLGIEAFRQAYTSPQGLDVILQKTSLYLRQRQRDEAERILQALFEGIQGVPVNQKAAVYVHVGRIYLEVAAFDQAKNAFEDALRQKEDLREAYFGLGLVEVMQGNLIGASEKYKAATQRFGKHGQAADILRQLVENNYQGEVAQSILSEFF